MDADAPSYLSRSVKNVLTAAEEEKKRKYVTAAEARRGSFSPFVVTVDGALGPKAVLFLRHLVEKLCIRWKRGYGEILGWTKARLSFAVIRATNLCLYIYRIRQNFRMGKLLRFSQIFSCSRKFSP